MPAIALVSKTSPEQHAALHALAPGRLELIDCSADRESLAARGAAAEIVYGNVRAHERAALPNLKWIHATWTGVENLLHPELLERGILVTNTRGQVSVAMAEHALACILHAARDLDAFRRAKTERRWKAGSQPRLLEGSRALILGLGSIGAVLAEKLAALGVRVRGVNSDGRPAPPCDETCTLDAVRERLGDVDWLVCLLPATAKTRKALDEAFFRALKPGALVLNLSRGAVLDEAALLRQLDAGHLAGAILDVTDPEPPPPDSPLFAHPKVLLTGHESPRGQPDRTRAFDLFVHNLRCYLAGEISGMQSRVDPAKGY
ncbi:MAG: 2-hydroxyacid dehydrogenase [Planctomycetota bacterium]